MANTSSKQPVATASEAPKESYIVADPLKDGVVAVQASSPADAVAQLNTKEQA